MVEHGKDCEAMKNQIWFVVGCVIGLFIIFGFVVPYISQHEGQEPEVIIQAPEKPKTWEVCHSGEKFVISSAGGVAWLPAPGYCE